MFTAWRLTRNLRRLAKIIQAGDRAAQANKLLDTARLIKRDPTAGARTCLALYEKPFAFDELALANNGVAYKPGQPVFDGAAQFAGLRWETYELALALWHRKKMSSPLKGLENAAPVQKLADYGGGNEVWRIRKMHRLRFDVGGHVSKWRDDPISRKQAEQAVLGEVHFTHLVLAIQQVMTARGLDANAGSTMTLPDPQ